MRDIISFLKSFYFLKGVMKTIAVILPVLVGWLTGHIGVGLPIGLSVLMISPCDIPGNRKHHIRGILIATFLAVLSSVCINLALSNFYILLLTIVVLVFANSYISLYGFRASMVAISGLFGISMTLAHPREGWEILYNAFYITLGGLWFISLVLFHLWIKPRQYSEQLLGKCMGLISDFFLIRSQLVISKDRRQGIEKLLELQTTLNNNFETLREVLLDNRSKSGKTAYLQRQFLIFIELVDIFELGVANTVPYESLDETFKEDNRLLTKYSLFLKELSKELKHISYYIGKRKYIQSEIDLHQKLESLQKEVIQAKEEDHWKETSDKWIMLRNFYDYFEKQVGKVENIQFVFTDYYKNPSYRDDRSYRRFVSEQSYSLKRLRYHFTFESAIFRHSLRLTFTVVVGFLIGLYFNINNAYWILLTIFITMRPTYGLTKERSQKRIKGTVIGVLIAGIIVFTFPTVYLFAVIGLICMPLAFALIQKNYTTGATFITIGVVMIYAFLTPDPLEPMKFRLLDTAIGVGLAIIANHTIFPYWEYKKYDEMIVNSIKANIDYVRQVKEVYNNEKRELTTTYKVARKEAFLSGAKLNSAFQRMMQEPKSQQKDKMKAYEIMVIQQAFISSVATLGVSIHQTKTRYLEQTFNKGMDNIIKNLEECIIFLNEGKESLIGKQSSLYQPFDKMEREIKKLQSTKLDTSEVTTYQSQKSFRELHMYSQQLNYLFSLTENLKELMVKENI